MCCTWGLTQERSPLHALSVDAPLVIKATWFHMRKRYTKYRLPQSNSFSSQNIASYGWSIVLASCEHSLAQSIIQAEAICCVWMKLRMNETLSFKYVHIQSKLNAGFSVAWWTAHLSIKKDPGDSTTLSGQGESCFCGTQSASSSVVPCPSIRFLVFGGYLQTPRSWYDDYLVNHWHLINVLII